MDGTAQKETFFLIKNDPTPVVDSLDSPSSLLRDCCGSNAMSVLADIGSADEFKNDVTGFLWYFDSVISTASLELWKSTNGVYAKAADLNDNTYGTFSAFQFFTNNAGENFIGYQLEWKNVLTTFGSGFYKVYCNLTSGLTGDDTLQSVEYCLKQFTPDRANGTIKIEYYLNGVTGVIADDKKTKDYGTISWYNSMRLNGFFGFPDTKYATEYVDYNNGQRLYVEDEQEPEYVLKLKPVNNYVHEVMRVDVMMADMILVTDYNSKNPGSFIKKAIQKTSGYSPDWKRMKSKLAPVEIKFRQEFNNLKKFRE